MDITETLQEARNLLDTARIVATTYQSDPDNYRADSNAVHSALQEALNDLVSEFKRIESA